MRTKARSLSHAKQLLLLAFLLLLNIYEHFTPQLAFTRNVKPVRFSILASLAIFSMLFVLPLQPISLPLAVGAGLSFALICTSIRRVTCYAYYV